MLENTLLGRCTVAFTEALMRDVPPTTEQKAAARRGVASVLEHLAAEMVWLNQKSPNLNVHGLAQMLTLEAAGELAGWADDDDDDDNDDDHPSLNATERNPSLT